MSGKFFGQFIGRLVIVLCFLLLPFHAGHAANNTGPRVPEARADHPIDSMSDEELGQVIETRMRTASDFSSATVCGSIALAKRPLYYCYMDPSGRAKSGSSDINVVYYLHGHGGSPQDFFKGFWAKVISALPFVYGQKVPVLVGLSLGSAGVFNDETGDIAVNGLPQVEAKIAPGKRLHRVIVGASMGGHNGLRLIGETPKSFSAGAVLCPAIATFDGYDDREVEAYIARNRAYMNIDFFRRALASFKSQIPNSADWIVNNPFTFLDRGAYDGVPLFLSVGRQDTLGFVEGSREFKLRADHRPAMKVEYREFFGPHCTFDIVAFFRFMRAQLP